MHKIMKDPLESSLLWKS